MALPSILSGNRTTASDQLADLHARVLAQGLEIARLSRDLAALRAAAVANSPITVQRSGCALIADRLGINERTATSCADRYQIIRLFPWPLQIHEGTKPPR